MEPKVQGYQSWIELMILAMAEAAIAADVSGDVPVGAVLVAPDGQIVALGRNEREANSDPSAHAEIVAIRKAATDRRDWRLEDLTLVVTLEPCVMCAGAIVAARIPRVVFGAWDERVGAAGSLCDVLRDVRLGRPVEVIAGVLETECAEQLREFFAAKR
jgi:tRNA(adenine34) deaminase